MKTKNVNIIKCGGVKFFDTSITKTSNYPPRWVRGDWEKFNGSKMW